MHYQILVLGVQNQVQSTGHPPNSIYTTVQLYRTLERGKPGGGVHKGALSNFGARGTKPSAIDWAPPK